MKKKNILILLKKVHYYHQREWCGSLLSTEILWLIEIGCKPTKSSAWKVECAEDEVRTGKINQHWFYFYPNKKFLEMIEK